MLNAELAQLIQRLIPPKGVISHLGTYNDSHTYTNATAMIYTYVYGLNIAAYAYYQSQLTESLRYIVDASTSTYNINTYKL